MYIPKQVIVHLVKYMRDGCELEVVTEEFNGKRINRWIADNKVILWSESATPPSPFNHTSEPDGTINLEYKK
jgi:hypothetical protein